MSTTTIVTVLTVVVGAVVGTVVDGSSIAERWDPQWLRFLVIAAVVLVAAAVAWWLLLVLRVQDWLRDQSSYRRKH